MECHHFRLLIQRYLDGDLDAIERAEYENHRRLCGICREMDRQFSSVFEVLSEIPHFEPSLAFNEKVIAGIDISRYRESAASKVWNFVGRIWDRVPTPVRVGGAVVAVLVLFLTAYRPWLDFLISVCERTVTSLGTSLIALKELGGRSEILLKHFSSTNNYRIAGETLMRTFHRIFASIPVPYFILAAAVLVVILFVIVKTARGAWKKGETHVGLF